MVSTAVRSLAIGLLCAACTTTPVVERWTFDEGAVIRGDRTRPELSLVFTGGEFGEGTAQVLDVLRRRSIRASFFLTGAYLDEPEQRAQVATMIEDGHYVGPHSDRHLLYCAWDDRQHSLVDEATFDADLLANLAELRDLGALPAGAPVYFVPPFEWFNRKHVAWAAARGVTLVNFTPGSGSNRDYIPEGDPRFVPSADLRDEILAFDRSAADGLNGFLLLLHLGSARRDKMHDELAALIDALAARGHRFVRVDELLDPAGLRAGR